MATTSFTMPDLGEGIHEAEVLAVLVKKGAAVKEGDVLLEVETDKAAVEIPSPYTGKISDIMVRVGEMVQVGETLFVFSDELSGSDQDPDPQIAADSPDSPVVRAREGKAGPVPAAPSTRRLARELGVDLHLVVPTGPGDRVLEDDVRKFAEAADQHSEEVETLAAAHTVPALTMEPSSYTLPEFSNWGKIERQPFRSIRRATAIRMSRSWSMIPHVTCQDTIDITELEAFRQRHRQEIEEAGGRLTMTVFSVKAVATALKNFPRFNASLDLDAEEIIIKHYFHIGVAVDTEHGLVVPVIRDVDRKSIKEIAIELHDLVSRARERKLSRDELQGGTFTITNAGASGGGFFSPIINYPEIAILGLGQGRMQPAVVADNDGNHDIKPRLIMPVMLCFDHRVVDGADAIRFLQVIIDSLGDPDELLITMI